MEMIKDKWLRIWKGFEEKHPKLAKWAYQIFYFFVFSMGVTIFQYLVFTFLPGILGQELAGTEFMWPQVPLTLFGVEFTWSLLGYNVLRDSRCSDDWRRAGILYQLRGRVIFGAVH